MEKFSGSINRLYDDFTVWVLESGDECKITPDFFTLCETLFSELGRNILQATSESQRELLRDMQRNVYDQCLMLAQRRVSNVVSDACAYTLMGMRKPELSGDDAELYERIAGVVSEHVRRRTHFLPK